MRRFGSGDRGIGLCIDLHEIGLDVENVTPVLSIPSEPLAAVRRELKKFLEVLKASAVTQK